MAEFVKNPTSKVKFNVLIVKKVTSEVVDDE